MRFMRLYSSSMSHKLWLSINLSQCTLPYVLTTLYLFLALNFGDPHIVTLDGKNYTFNGYGEYTMLKISKDSVQFYLQARTDLATTANGTSINATIFSAFVALDQTGSKLQIEMSQDKTSKAPFECSTSESKTISLYY